MQMTDPNATRRAFLKTPDAARFIGLSRRGFLDLAEARGLASYKPSPKLRLWRTNEVLALATSAPANTEKPQHEPKGE